MQTLQGRSARSGSPLSNAARKQLGIQPEVIRNIDKHEQLPNHLHVGQHVMFQDSTSKHWYPAVIESLCPETRSYKIKTSDGVVYRKCKHISSPKHHRMRSHKQCSVCHNQWHNQTICCQWNNLTTRSHEWTIIHKYIQADLKGTLSPRSSLIYKYFKFYLMYMDIYIVFTSVFKWQYNRVQANGSLRYTCMYLSVIWYVLWHELW